MNTIPSCASFSENAAFSLKNPYLNYHRIQLWGLGPSWMRHTQDGQLEHRFDGTLR